jgi:hypothetical protein
LEVVWERRIAPSLSTSALESQENPPTTTAASSADCPTLAELAARTVNGIMTVLRAMLREAHRSLDKLQDTIHFV